MARADGSIIIDTRIDTANMQRSTDQIQGMFKGLISGAKKVGAAIAAAFAIKQVVAFAKECIELGSDLDEVQNVVDVTFGGMSDTINEWSKNAITQFGLSELSAKQYTSTLGAMLKSMGITGNELVTMSTDLAGLAGDLASFYNLDTDQAFQKIRSGISGETEPLKQLGINLSEANLQQFALNQGMETAYKDMNQQQKAMLRYNYLLSVTSDAQGDFARTSGSWANQVRVLHLQFQSIKADLGKGFINLFTPILRVINAVLQGVAKMASAFKAFTALITGQKADTSTSAGTPVADTADDYGDAAEAADDYANATDKAAKATQKANRANSKYTSGLDKIHQYQSQAADATKATTPKATAPSSAPSAAVDFGSLSQGNTVIDKTAQKMKDLYDKIVKGVQPTIDALKRLWNEGLGQVGKFAGKALKDFYNEYLVPIGKWTFGEGIPKFVDALNKGLMAVDWNKINEGLKALWKQLAPFAIHVGEGLLWFWKNVLVPLGTWTLNEVVPRFLTMMEKAVGALNTIIEVGKPGFLWFWNDFLIPIAQWTGDKFLSAMDWVNEKLDAFTKWCKENPEAVSNMTTFITAFFTALAGAAVIAKIGSLVAVIGKLLAGLNPITIAIAAVVAAGVLLYKNWDKVKEVAAKAWKAIKDTVTKTAATIKKGIDDFITSVRNVWDKGWNLVKTGAQTAWSGIKSTLEGAWNGIKTTAGNVFNGIKTAAQNAWNGITGTASTVWNGLKSTITNVFTQISKAAGNLKMAIQNAFVNAFEKVAKLIKTPINGVIGAINGIIKGIVTGINAMIAALNKLHFSVPKWVPGIGGNTFGLNIPPITSYPQIPKLATGAVIPPNAPFAAVLGDQRRGNNIEAPESLIRRIVREEGNGNARYEFKAVLNRRVLFDEIIAEAKLRQSGTARNPFELA